MEKNIKDYLHLYLGCEVMYIGIKHILSGIYSPDACFINTLRGTTLKPIDIISVKPILRPLSDMTEEDLIKLLQITIPDDFEDAPTDDDYDLEIFYNDGGNLADSDVAIGANFSCRCYEGQIVIRECGSIHQFDESGDLEKIYNLPKAYKYLLSKHFDLFNLIESGLAIDKTTIKQLA